MSHHGGKKLTGTEWWAYHLGRPFRKGSGGTDAVLNLFVGAVFILVAIGVYALFAAVFHPVSGGGIVGLTIALAVLPIAVVFLLRGADAAVRFRVEHDQGGSAGNDDPPEPPPPNVNPTGSPKSPTDPSKVMSAWVFVVAFIYLLALIGIFIAYTTSPGFRGVLPSNLGKLPVGVVWFGAVGGVISSFNGIFTHNKDWDCGYNYWHGSRLFFSAVTGAIGSLIYLVLLSLGSTKPIVVDHTTFYVVAFLFGFADKYFIQLVHNLATTVIKPANRPTT